MEHHPVRVGGNLHSLSLSPGLASKDGGGRGEGGNQLFRPRSRRGGEKVKGKNLRKVRSRVSFCSEKAVVDGAIVSFVTVRVSFSGGQTRYNPPVQHQVTNSLPFLSAAVQCHSQSSRILEF